MASPAIWYRLVNSLNGESYQATTAAKVSVGPNSDVDDFRKQVHLGNLSILTGFASSQLLVYTNKTTFDNRNAAVGKEEPLEEDCLLSDLGKSKKEALIVVVPSSLPSSDVNEHSTKRRRVNEEKHFLQDLQSKIPTPSSFANCRDRRCWVKFLRDNPNEIICHRDNSEEPSVPVCLLTPIFTHFIDDMKNIVVSSHDCSFVSKLTESMCGAFGYEKERTDKFVNLFEEYTGLRLGPVTRDYSATDASAQFGNGALYCNLEVKVEKGSGHGDPYMHSIAYYIKNLPKAADTTQYPCFLLELCGAAFSVSGIVNTENQVICDPLSPTYHLFCNQEFFMTLQITKLFASLRKNLITLRSQEFNDSLSPVSPFPFVSSFLDRNSNVQFKIQYQKRIQGLLFSTQILDSDEELVVVKFCSRYNQDVHLHCHSCGFAPRLISFSTLGNYVVVVMEKLNLRALTRDDHEKADIQEQIKSIANKLKEMSYVHGDLRDCNIHIDAGTNRVVLVDFDWSGVDGVDLYPPFMNPVIKWPEGASTGQPLRHEHDNYWLKQYIW